MTEGSPMDTEPPVSGLSYAAAMEELDAIVQALDEGSLDVDNLAGRFQRAVDIVEELDRRIMANRAKIDELAPRLRRLSVGGPGTPAGSRAPSQAGQEAFGADEEPF